MRILPFAISVLATIIVIIALNISWGIPPMGKFLSPQHGFWANADPVNKDFNLEINFPSLKNRVEVYFDERLVPHIFAIDEKDAYFVQGYLHAKFRLWQMEFQTHAAAGRVSELLGEGPNKNYLNFDRQMRRLGMVYGAEKSLIEMEKNSETKSACDAYTAGVNSYIESLKKSELPLEYKLLNYLPEKWTNLKTALFLKYMSLDLAGGEQDFEMTHAKAVFSQEDFEKIYPIAPDSLDPVVPRGTSFDSISVKLQMPPAVDSIYFQQTTTVSIFQQKPDRDNGSNNWAVAGTKTQSGRPILCNDPHLGLNLPSLWYEVQISTSKFNAYGASFPGAPGVIIGFNDDCAWGFTNAMRDVRDYYEIKFKDDSKTEYWFNGEWKKSELRIDEYKVKNGGIVKDTVAYTVFGPVMYDKSFTGLVTTRTDGKSYAVRWKAHDPSNELMIFYKLNHAKNYTDYYNALQYLTCPGQNCLFASKAGDIAIWHQAVFPAKWRRQGDFVMPGTDSSFMWQGYIPINENPHLINPSRGFVSSANQLPADTSYPYYIGGHHDLYRGLLINRYLEQMNGITPKDMQKLQTENYNVFAETALPVLLQNINRNTLNPDEIKYLDILREWNRRNDPDEKGAAIFNIWFDSLEVEIWGDEFTKVSPPVDWPEEYTLAEGLKRDSIFKFVDNINTPEVESLIDIVTTAFKKAVPILMIGDRQGKLPWSKFKDTGIQHLLRLSPLSRLHLNTGGGNHIINATKQFHGPSWRMIVHLTDKIEAYGIYPGGQHGNPGSKYYDNSIDQWAAGQYNLLWMMKKEEQGSSRVISKMTFSNNKF